MSAGEAERNRWAASGVFKRIDAAIRDRTPVQIKRSSGEMVTGYAVENGFAGMGLTVAWGPGANEWWAEGGGYRFPQGVQNKVVRTEDFLEWNPAIAGTSVVMKSPHQQEVERLRSEIADVLRAIGPLVGKLPPDHAHRMAELRVRVTCVYDCLGPAGSPYEHEIDE